MIFLFLTLFLAISCTSAPGLNRQRSNERSFEYNKRKQSERDYKSYYSKNFSSFKAGSKQTERCSSVIKPKKNNSLLKVCIGERTYEYNITIVINCNNEGSFPHSSMSNRNFQWEIGNSKGLSQTNENGILKLTLHLDQNQKKQKLTLKSHNLNFVLSPNVGPFLFHPTSKECKI